MSTTPSRTTKRLHALLFVVLALFLAAVMPVTAGMPAHADPTKDPNLDQTVNPDEEYATGRAELGTGHVDIGPRFDADDAWKLQVRDDTRTPPTWRSVNDVLVRVNDHAVLELPDDPQYEFLGIPGGSSAHVVPQTQNQQVVWLGWNTQDPKVTERIDRGAKLVLHRVEGPGSFHVFLQNGFDAPQPLWANDGGDGQEIWVDVNTHTHANWVFSEPGVYLVEFSVVAKGRDGEEFADRGVLRFAVGDDISAEDAWAATLPAVEPQASEAKDSSAPEADGKSMGTTWIGIIVAAAVIVIVGAVALIHTLRSRAARKAAIAAEDARGDAS